MFSVKFFVKTIEVIKETDYSSNFMSALGFNLRDLNQFFDIETISESQCWEQFAHFKSDNFRLKYKPGRGLYLFSISMWTIPLSFDVSKHLKKLRF